MEKKFTLKQVRRLIEWMKEHGHTDAEIIDCIVALSDDPQKEGKKEKPATNPPKTK